MSIKVQLIIFCWFLIRFSSAEYEPLNIYYEEEEDMFRIKILKLHDYEEDLTIPPDPSFKVAHSDVNFYLYDKNHFSPLQIPAHSVDQLTNSHFDPNKKQVFLIHGWRCNYESALNTQVRRAILRNEDVNIFVVDWSGPAGKLYVLAKTAVPKVGEIVGNYINQMISQYNIPKSKFYLIGHSLGAHVAGCIGATAKGLHSIVGLDPAGPLFTISNTNNRLDTTDAEFVHVIHTNAKQLGFGSAIGHVDYYPDGGSKQNECGLDLLGICSHGKSYEYYAMSISNRDYEGIFCDSYKNYLIGKCDENPISLMGGLDVDRTASGSYFLTITSLELF